MTERNLSMASDIGPAFQRNFVHGIGQILYSIHINEQSRANLQAHNQFIIDHPEYSLIMDMNHVSRPDVLFAYDLYRTYIDPHGTRTLITPASDWHLRLANDWFAAILMPLFAKALNYEPIRVVQDYMQKEPEKYGYTPVEITKVRRRALARVSHLRRNKKKGLALLVASEGRRSFDGVLQEPDPNTFGIIDKLKPAYVVPAGIVYPDVVDYVAANIRTGLHFRARVDLNVGAGIVDPENQEQIMMAKAQLLPEYQRGRFRTNLSTI